LTKSAGPLGSCSVAPFGVIFLKGRRHATQIAKERDIGDARSKDNHFSKINLRSTIL
jgi:hypothetical protein